MSPELRGTSELVTRYGPIPGETLNLFEVMAIKMELKKLKINKMAQGKDSLIFSFHDQTPVEPQKVLQLVNSAKDRIRFTPDARLIVKPSGKDFSSDQMIFNISREVIQSLQQ